MNFLELCQMVARESGTVSGNLPASVNNQTGRLGKIVHWTATAWLHIQNKRNAWLWMRDEFEGVTAPGTTRYTPAAMNIVRFGEWITEDDTVTVYKQSEGKVGERPLLFMPWQMYRRRFTRGVQQQDRPLYYTISPANEVCIGPEPDDLYVIRGEYRKGPQPLENNEDVPEMPARFHEAIAWYGLLLLAEHDEGQIHIAVAMRRYRDLMNDLERDQLPRMFIGADALA